MDIEKNQDKKNVKVNAQLYTEGSKIGKETKVKIESPAPNSKKIIIEKEVNVKSGASKHSEASSKVSDLLDAVYRISGMGLESIEAANKDIDCAELKAELESENASYKSFHERVKQEMKDAGLKLEQPNAIVKAMRWSAVRLNALTHKTSSNIAEMMINGTTMGIIEIRRNSNAIGGNNSAAPFAEEFYNYMRESVDRLTAFL